MVRPMRHRAKSTTPLDSITVGFSSDPLAPSSPQNTPILNDLPTPLSFPPSTTEDNEDTRITWSTQMVEALVEYIHRAFKQGRLSDNGLKKEL
jgi:hypothetical protein